MNKKGFTLIELLAIIIILGVILLIVIPAALNTVDGANKRTFSSSASKVIDVAKLYVMNNNIELPAVGNYISIPISSLNFENKTQYNTNGGVLIINHGIVNEPRYQYFIYISNNDYLLNGAAPGFLTQSVKNIGTVSPNIPVALPSSGNVSIDVANGVTSHVNDGSGGGFVNYILN